MKMLLALFMVALAACSSSSDGSSVSTSPEAVAADDVPECESFAGQPTLDVANHFNDGNPCARDIGLNARETSYLGMGHQACDDETALYWNDVGWGASDGEWMFAEDGVPPDDVFAACQNN